MIELGVNTDHMATLREARKGAATYYIPGERLVTEIQPSPVRIDVEFARPVVTATPEALSPQPEALSPQPEALSPQPEALSPQPEALSPQPEALSPQPEALSPQSPARDGQWIAAAELPANVREVLSGVGQRAEPATVEKAIIDLCAWRPLRAEELSHLLGRRKDYLKRHYLRKMVRDGHLVHSNPEQPNSPRQAYIAVGGGKPPS